jgi:hypothetical protein
MTKIVETDKIAIPNTHIHDRSLSWLGIRISIKQKKVAGLN